MCKAISLCFLIMVKYYIEARTDDYSRQNIRIMKK